MKKLGITIFSIFLSSYILTVLILFPRWTVDDAYITFRYAENLAVHSELTWNVGEEPVEGYTGVALPVMLALLIKMGISPVTASHAIGMISFLVGGFFLYLHAGGLGLDNKVSIFSFRTSIRDVLLLLYGTAPFMYTHVFSGLETVLFTSFVLISAFALHKCMVDAKHQALIESSLLLILLATSLIRPEGVVLALIFMPVLIFIKLKYRKAAIIHFCIKAFLLYVVPAVIYFVWRWNYYGQLMPNTFYAKSFNGIINLTSVRLLLEFLIEYMALPVASVGVLLFRKKYALFGDLKQRLKSAQIGPVIAHGSALIFVIIISVQYMRSLLLMNYAHRFFASFYPLLLIGLGMGWKYGLSGLRNSDENKISKNKIFKIVTASLLSGQLIMHGINLHKELLFTSRDKKGMDEVHIRIGKLLRDYAPASEWLIVHIDAGAIPYFSKLQTVDFGRLNDQKLAHGMSHAQAVEYFYSFNPGAVVFTSYDWEHVFHGTQAACIVNDGRFQNYTLVKKYQTSVWKNYYEFVYIRNDLVDPHKPFDVF